MPHTTGNPVSLYYEVHGSGSPLLMIMGLGASIADWFPKSIEHLSQKHQVIVFDNRGTGHSSSLTTAFTMTDLANYAISVLDTLDINKAHVFGVSLGGMIAQQVALHHPKRVLSLILGCTAPTGNVNHPKLVAPSQETLMQIMKPPSGNRALDIEAGHKLAFTPHFIERNAELLEGFRKHILSYPACPPEAKQLQFAAVSTHDTYDQLDNILCPVLIQTGTDDSVIPAENSRVMARLMPESRLLEYEACGHDFLAAGGEKVINDIFKFLDEVDKRELQRV
jgi:3-oxoadipate enol-lactonase